MSPRGRDQAGWPRLLVVDDEAATREGLARVVAGWGYQVEAAASAEAALELVDECRPDVVITDLVLPEMDGLKLLERMLEAPRPPVVLLITGHASVETAVEAMRRGAADFLTKPVEIAQLQVRLEKAIERAALGREVDLLRHRLRHSGPFGQLAGPSPAMDEIVVDTRIIAATNRDPTEALASGQLRDDLLYRINVFTIELPPLRERVGDLPHLVKLFIEEFNARENRSVKGLAPETEEVLTKYHWPGNVRELRNVLQRAVILGVQGFLRLEHLPEQLLGGTAAPTRTEGVPVTLLREMERLLIVRALEAFDYDKPRAAATLGISLKTLYNKLAKYGIPLAKPER